MPSPSSPRAVTKQAAPPGAGVVERSDDGVWRYAGTSIPAVGAQDRTLSDVLCVREIRAPGRPPEAVVLSLSEIVADSRLNWVLQAGTRLRGGDEDQFWVPWPVWEERAAAPVDVWLPERDAKGLSRQLAIAERDVRFLREALETSTTRRSQLVLLGTELGMTRRQIAGTVGLSAGRVQQLHEEVHDEQVTAVQQTIDDADLLLEHADDALNPSRMEIPQGWTQEKLDDVLAHLVDVGLLEATGDDNTLALTETAMDFRNKADAEPSTHSRKQRTRVDARATR